MSAVVLIVLGVAGAAVVLLVIVGLLAVLVSRGQREEVEDSDLFAEPAVDGAAERGDLGRV